MAAKDFLADRLRTNKIIAPGGGFPELSIYSKDSAGVNTTGGLDSSVLNVATEDVFLFVSGSIGSKNSNPIVRGTTMFGGDFVVKGYSYFDHQISISGLTSSEEITTVEDIKITDGSKGLYTDNLYKKDGTPWDFLTLNNLSSQDLTVNTLSIENKSLDLNNIYSDSDGFNLYLNYDADSPVTNKNSYFKIFGKGSDGVVDQNPVFYVFENSSFSLGAENSSYPRVYTSDIGEILFLTSPGNVEVTINRDEAAAGNNYFTIKNDSADVFKISDSGQITTITGSTLNIDNIVAGGVNIANSLVDGVDISAFETSTNTNISSLQDTDIALQTSIDNEASTRLSRDNELQASINSLQTDVDQNEADADAAITAEAAARSTADQTLQINIDTEEADRIIADANLQNQIDSLQADVDQNELDSDAAESAIIARLNILEADPATGTDLSDLQADIDQNEADADAAIAAEASSRQTAISNLQSQINSLITDVDQNESDADAAIAAEILARTQADTSLQSNIDTLTTTINTLQSDVDQNESDADAAISTLQTDLNTEITERNNSDNTLFALIQGLQNDVDQNESDGDLDRAAIRNEFLLADNVILGDAANDYNTLGKLEDKIISLQADVDQNEVDADSAITVEATARSTADINLQANLDALQLVVTNNKSSIDSGLAAEVLARTQTDSALDLIKDNIIASSGLKSTGEFKDLGYKLDENTLINFINHPNGDPMNFVEAFRKVDSEIKTNQNAINTIGGGTALDLTKIKERLGQDNQVDQNILVTYDSINFIANEDDHNTAIGKLDQALNTELSALSIFDLQLIPASDQSNSGKILQYLNDGVNPEEFVFVDPQAGPQGPAGNDGRGISSVTENNDGTFTLVFTDGQNPFTTIDLTGSQGPIGPDGPAGAPGLNGDKGDKGDTGDPGPAGAAATIAVGNITTGDAGTNATVTNVGTAEAASFDFTIPKGDKGDTGDPGQAGADATIAIGNVITGDEGTNVSITNTGNNSAAVFDFTIPKGDKGDTGDIGQIGPIGLQGDAGPAGSDGDSAYQVWSDQGNAGDEAAFLASLKGDTGDAGAAGSTGESAYQVWLDEGNVGDEAAFLASLKGDQGDAGIAGANGDSAYQVWLDEGNAGDEATFLASLQGIQGDQGEVGPAGAAGQQGQAGTDAPTISGLSIDGSTITTSFNGANDIVSNNSFAVSIADLDNVNIDLGTIANGKILKWDNNTNNFIAADDQSGGGGGGGVDLTVTDNTTSVGQSSTLDVQQLATVTDSGNNEATLVGIIGNAEDNYDDGLFTDFTPTTTIGTAIDRFNEVLKALAPTPAPDLDQFDVDTANSALQNIKLSFGTSNDQSAAGTPYASAGDVSGFEATDVNEIFAIESVNGNYRKGIYTGSTSITGTLNEDVSNDTYTNNIVNYLDNSFSNGDQGTLQLWLNGNKLDCDVDLSSDGAGDYLDANGSGFINLTTAISGKFSSNTEFPTFKHRQGEWKVDSASQRNGWNYVQVKHVVGANTKETGFAEWINDSNNEAISVTNKSLSLNMAGSKYLSGIQYHTSGTATYTANIDNFYKYVYETDNMTFTESPDAIANFDSIAISSIDTGSGEDHTKQINLSQTSSLLPISNRLLNQSLTTGFSLDHPIKANITAASTNETVTGILLDNVAANSTVILDNFNDEQYRQTVENAYTQTNLTDADVNDPSNVYSWDSTESLVGADTGHNTGLIVYNSRLYSPKSSDLPNSGNFSTLSSSHANPDYSAINNNDVKAWIRKFKNNSGNTIKALLFNMNKSNSDIVNSNTPNSDEINVQFKIASKPGDLGAGIPLQEESNWLNVTENFDLAEYLAGTITGCGDSVYNGNDFSANTINNKIAILNTAILNDEYVLVKITASADWAGYVDSINVSFVDVIGNVVDAPEIEHIDLEQTGATGIISFGTTNTINNFANYTSDINTLFDLSGNKTGIFDNTQTFTGFINDLTNANGNNYAQYAFGGSESHKGTLKLHVNGQDVHTINLATKPYLTGSQLNNNGSGFTNLTSPLPARDNNNRPDFESLYRTSKFVITPADQRLGYNFAKVIHVTENGDEESNTIEWINDNNTDAPDFTDNGASTCSIDSAQISSTETNSLSGIAYYKKVTNVPYEISVKNLYKNIYSSANDAIIVSDTDNNSKIKSILVTGINNNSITNSGSHTLPGNSRSGSKALPAITAASDESEVLNVVSIFEVDYVKSILDLDAVDNYTNMNDITINTSVKHPLNAANGKTTSGVNEIATSLKFLQYTVSANNQTLVEEDFSNETRRLLSNWANANDNQAAASGSSWDSTAELTDGLMMYDDKLRYPEGDFRDANANIHAPAGNPNYTGSTGTKSFYRIFQNNTQNAKTGFSLELQGNGSVIVDPGTDFSATNIKISVKIPETGDSQATGYLNIAKAFETGQYSDGDGSLSGNIASSITNGQTTINTITFGQKFLQPNEYFVLKLEANENWTGYLSNITVDWS